MGGGRGGEGREGEGRGGEGRGGEGRGGEGRGGEGRGGVALYRLMHCQGEWWFSLCRCGSPEGVARVQWC